MGFSFRAPGTYKIYMAYKRQEIEHKGIHHRQTGFPAPFSVDNRALELNGVPKNSILRVGSKCIFWSGEILFLSRAYMKYCLLQKKDLVEKEESKCVPLCTSCSVKNDYVD